jgi:hypothetical protein
MVPRSVKIFVSIHIGITLMGLAAHMKLHPVWESLFFWWASPLSFFSLLVIPVLYVRPVTVAWGVLFNAMTVAIGTIGMSYYFLLTFESPVTFYRLILESTLVPIFILWTKLLLSYFIFVKVSPLKVGPQVEGCLE